MNSNSSTHSRRAPARLALATLMITGVSCYRAPERYGTDQVFDPNIQATMLKDGDLEALVWPEVDAVVEALLPDPGEPGCAVGIARDGELIYLEGYGKAVIGGADWSVATMGAVGSISKTLTAAAALRMHLLGLIDVNQTIGSYLPTSNGALAATAIHELMNHSGGVGGETQAQAFAPNWEESSPVPDCSVGGSDAATAFCDSISQFAASPEVAFGWYEAKEAVKELPKKDPGSGEPHAGVYSNVGYSVLGAVIDDAAQDTPSGGYEAWVWDEIGQYTGNPLSVDNLLSLALTHSWRSTDIPYRARGYNPAQNGIGFDLVEAFAPDQLGGFEGWEGPSGGWAMTIGDLTRLAVALHEDAVLGSLEDAMRLEWTQLAGWPDDLYGMGMFLNQNGARPPQWHGGAIGGHRASWGVWDNYAGKSLAVTMLCNRSDITPWNHANAIAAATVGSSPLFGEIQVAAVGKRSPGRRTFALDWGRAWQESPRGALLPFVLTDALVLETRAFGRGIGSSLVAAMPDRRGEGLAPIGKARWLGAVELEHGAAFSTARRDVALETTKGELELENLEIAGRVGEGSRSLSDISLRFALDTRQVGAYELNWNSICALARDAGAPCQSCRDGERACIDVEYRGLRAEQIAFPSP